MGCEGDIDETTISFYATLCGFFIRVRSKKFGVNVRQKLQVIVSNTSNMSNTLLSLPITQRKKQETIKR